MQINENEARDDQTREILDYYRGLPERSSQEAIVEMLRELQDIHGCISPYMLEQAAEAAGVRDSMVQAICKRYPSLKTAPYNHEIILCTGRNCASKGSITVMDELKKRLGVGKNGISEDGTVCLKTRNCLKNCRKAPNVMVDGRLCSYMVSCPAFLQFTAVFTLDPAALRQLVQPFLGQFQFTF